MTRPCQCNVFAVDPVIQYVSYLHNWSHPLVYPLQSSVVKIFSCPPHPRRTRGAFHVTSSKRRIRTTPVPSDVVIITRVFTLWEIVLRRGRAKIFSPRSVTVGEDVRRRVSWCCQRFASRSVFASTREREKSILHRKLDDTLLMSLQSPQ